MAGASFFSVPSGGFALGRPRGPLAFGAAKATPRKIRKVYNGDEKQRNKEIGNENHTYGKRLF